ncbi:hypothetical protein CP8484711_0329B, partial [Chlamydia psittaci 84-8471/1]
EACENRGWSGWGK